MDFPDDPAKQFTLIFLLLQRGAVDVGADEAMAALRCARREIREVSLRWVWIRPEDIMAENHYKDTTFSDFPCICQKNFITLHRNRRETRKQMARPRLRQDTYNHLVVAPCKVRSSYQARGKFYYHAQGVFIFGS